MNAIYKTNTYGLHWSHWVKTNGPSITCAILLRGCTPQQNSTIAVTSGPSFNQSLSWPYKFVYYWF